MFSKYISWIISLFIGILYRAPPAQTVSKMRKFLESIVQKSGKIRGLVREIDEHYTGSHLMQESHPYTSYCYPYTLQVHNITYAGCRLYIHNSNMFLLALIRQKKALKDNLQKLDKNYDECNEVLAKGECSEFKPPLLSGALYICMVIYIYIVVLLKDRMLIFLWVCTTFRELLI